MLNVFNNDVDNVTFFSFFKNYKNNGLNIFYVLKLIYTKHTHTHTHTRVEKICKIIYLYLKKYYLCIFKHTDVV